ncbi:hypothetical protein CA265_24340 [Sphingobacteriaceae bacterium GW460-11-11-14-LB5]|nr:hypothetical protein CA265_24340 [Sphingobacteriaceae bacterium GW460-11-11-14-LB5]
MKKIYFSYLVLAILSLIFSAKLQAQITTFIPFGANWNYLDNGTDQGTAWRSAYTETWSSGSAPLGYPTNKPVTTTVSYGSNASNKPVTTYFRKKINIANVSLYNNIVGTVKRDDGVVVYVNGTEVYRNNVGTGTVTYTTLAPVYLEYTDLLTFKVPKSLLNNGDNYIAVEIHQQSVSSSDIYFDLELKNIPESNILPYGSAWKYLDNGTDQAAAWRSNSFDDTSWTTNTAAFGYSASNLTTTVSYGGNSSAKYITTYFRKKINVSDINNYAKFNASIKRDDGAIVYVNGTEVYRNNIAAGTVNYTTLASLGDDGASPQSFTIPASAFVTGDNYIAVEVHQQSASSSDIFFDMEIKGEYKPSGIPPLLIASSPADDLTNVATSSNISLTFDQNVLKGTGNIILKNGGIVLQTIDVNSTAVSISGSVVTINPADFPFNAAINLEMPKGVFLATSGSKPTDAIIDSKTYNFGVVSQQTEPLTFFPFGTSWKYLDNGSNQSNLWTSINYNDLSWSGGPAPLGYASSGVLTTVGYGGNASSKYATTYFRKTFSIHNPSQYLQITGRIKKDDGAIVYVNGTEVYRGSLPTGTVSYTTLASALGNNTTINEFLIDPVLLKDGLNTIAVEIHQQSISSSDIFFDMELKGSTLPPAPAITRGPYLQMGGQNSATLRWRTNIATDTKVAYGTAQNSLTSSASNGTLTKEHEISVTNLTADTKYFYSVGTGTTVLETGANNYLRTAPLANTTRKIRVAAFGDCGNNSTNQKNTKNALLNYLGSNPTDVWLLLGDNAYESGQDSEYQTGFFDIYKDDLLKNVYLYPSPGNHDYANSGSRQDDHNIPYLSNFTMPKNGELGGVASGKKEYYSFDYGDIHFVALDAYGQEDNKRFYDAGSTQAAWLTSDLAANQKKWTIAFFHHPPYTKGSHNSDTESDLVAIRQNLIQILENKGVDLVINGHSHVYERSLLLKNNYGLSSTYSATNHAVSTSSGRYDGTTNSGPYITTSAKNQHGTIYVVSGSSGKVGGQANGYPLSFMQYSNNTVGGSFEFEVEGNRLDAKFIMANNTVADQFTIMKDVNKTTNITIEQGQPATLTASWIGNYKWNTGETTKSLIVNPTVGQHTYTVTDNIGGTTYLTDTYNITVVANTSPQALGKLSTKMLSNSVKLSWNTTSEQNTSHFDVLRADEQKKFQVIGKVNAKGNSDVNLNYSFVDLAPLADNNYYQVIKQEVDGKKQNSNLAIASNAENSLNFNIKQVSKQETTLSIFVANNTKTKIDVVGLTGRRLGTVSKELEKGYNTVVIPANLELGVNIISVTTDRNKLSKKIVYTGQ